MIPSFFSALMNGYHELYYSADYYWGIVNITGKRIITYTEGDIYEKTHETYNELYEDCLDHIDFLRSMEFEKRTYGEWERIEQLILEEMEKE